jgi:hypothetical protein
MHAQNMHTCTNHSHTCTYIHTYIHTYIIITNCVYVVIIIIIIIIITLVSVHRKAGSSGGQWPENNLAQSRPRRNSLQRTGVPPILPPAPSFPGNPYPSSLDGGAGGVGVHSYPTRRRNSLLQDPNFQMQQQLQEFQRMQAHQHQHQHQQQHQQQHQWGQHQQQQQQPIQYQYENVDLSGMYPGEHTPDQLGSFLTSGGGHFHQGGLQPDAYGMPQQNGQMMQGPGGVLGMAYYAASNFIRRAGDIASVVTGGRSRRGSLSGEVPAVSGQQAPVVGPSGQQHQQQWGQHQQQARQGQGQGQLDLQKERMRDDAIEVASFLHEVQTASTYLNQIHAVRKPEPVAEVRGRQRRTMSGTVYPVPSPFEENSNVGIGNLFPERVADNGPHAAINLEQFFLRCPTGGAITCIKWAGQIKGVQKVKKGKPKEGSENQSKKFDHCCFVSMTLEDGFSNVSVKVFCTVRLSPPDPILK